jgi:hypothetical protein
MNRRSNHLATVERPQLAFRHATPRPSRCVSKAAHLRGSQAVGKPIFQDGPNRFLGVSQSFLLGVSLGHDLSKGRNKHSEPPVRLGLQNYGELWFAGTYRLPG